EDVTVFTVLFAGLATVLHRYSDQVDFVVGTPVAGRRRPELETLVGCFVNTLPLRADLSGDPSFRELLGRIHARTTSALEHQDVPFEKLVEELGVARDPSRSPLFQVMFALQNAPMCPLQLTGLRVEMRENHPPATKFDLTLYAWNLADGLHLLAGFRTDLLAESTVRRLVGHLGQLLAGAVAEPGRPLSELPLMDGHERRGVLTAGRGPAAQLDG